jgi:hypothetical protein
MLSAFNKLHSMMLVDIGRGAGISYRTINSKHPHRLDFPREPEPAVKRANAELEADHEPDAKRKRGGKSKKSKPTKKSKKSKTTKKSKKSKPI